MLRRRIWNARPEPRTSKNGAVREEPAPVNFQVLYYSFAAVKAAGVTEVPVIDFPSDETVAL